MVLLQAAAPVRTHGSTSDATRQPGHPSARTATATRHTTRAESKTASPVPGPVWPIAATIAIPRCSALAVAMIDIQAAWRLIRSRAVPQRCMAI
mmetsp:Transcript_8321/g.32817  ORF Transcript_8321/g.32817 Transcript_8321/m.32817 type:complete len:94 (-) Transcript_8321:1538-1819(-)